MSRPTHHEIAAALGVRAELVSTLERRGMPTGRLRDARAWFAAHGLHSFHAKPHGTRGLHSRGRVGRGG